MARILVIDDDPAILVTVELVLRRAGHEVVTTINPYAGLERLEQATFDLVIVDLFMPEMDGLEAITQISLRYPKLAIIFVSGHSFEQAVAQRPDFLALERSAFIGLGKPFAPRSCSRRSASVFQPQREKPRASAEGQRRFVIAHRDAYDAAHVGHTRHHQGPAARVSTGAARCVAGRRTQRRLTKDRTAPFSVSVRRRHVVAGYSPVRSECDPVPLMRSLAGKGAQLALPVSRRTRPCRSRNGVRANNSTAGPFGILQPRPSALDVEPDIILVPLVGFDRSGHRIGYGVGYYDRALQALRARRPVIAVGVAFAIQEIDAVVADANDQHLDLILTERDVIDPRGA